MGQQELSVAVKLQADATQYTAEFTKAGQVAQQFSATVAAQADAAAARMQTSSAAIGSNLGAVAAAAQQAGGTTSAALDAVVAGEQRVESASAQMAASVGASLDRAATTAQTASTTTSAALDAVVASEQRVESASAQMAASVGASLDRAATTAQTAGTTTSAALDSVIASEQRVESASAQMASSVSSSLDRAATTAQTAGTTTSAALDAVVASEQRVESASMQMASAMRTATQQASTAVMGLSDTTQRSTTQASVALDGLTAAWGRSAQGPRSLNDVMGQWGRSSAAGASALREADGQVRKLGVSSAQTAAAMRMVPAQFTDIVVSLQSGKSPLTVLMQQGGQLKDSFGGVGAAARGLGSYVGGLVGPFTLGAAAAGAWAIAAYQGSQEAGAYSQALIMNGNAAGTNASQLAASAREISRSVGTQGAAAEALVEIAGSGKVAARDIEAVGTAALAMREATGKGVGDSVKEFAKLRDEPVKASLALNEQYHYLTDAVYQQIAALEKQGDKDAAASLAQRTYAQAMRERAAEVQSNLGYIERGWNTVTNAAKRAWDAMVNVGRADTLQDIRGKIEQTQNKLNALLTQGDGFATTGGGAATGGGGRGTAAAIARLREELSALQGLAAPQEAAEATAMVKAEQQRIDDAKIAARERLRILGEGSRSRAEQRAEEIRKLDADYAVLGARDSQYTKLLAAINEKYKDPAPKKSSGAAGVGETEVARLRAVAVERERELAALQARDTASTKLTQSEREVLKLTEELKTSISGKVRVGKEAQLVEAQRGAVAERQIEVLKAQEKLERDLADQMAKTEASGWKAADSIGAQADAQEAANAIFGMGKSALAELTLEQQRKSLADLEATDRVIPGYVAALRQQIAEQERYVAALKSGEGLDAQKKATDQLEKDQERAAEATQRRWEQVGQSLADDLMRGGKSAGEYLQGYFRTLVLRPVISAGVGLLASAVGLGPVASAGGVGGGGGIGGIASTASNLSTAYSLATGGGVYGAFGAGVSSGLSGFAAGETGAMLANAYSGMTATGATAGGTAYSAGTAVGAAAIPAAVAALVLNIAGAFKSERISDVGFSGTLARGNTTLDAYKEWRTGGSLISGPEYNKVYSDVASDQAAAMSSAVDLVYKSVGDQVKALGFSAQNIDSYTQAINVSTQGLSAEQAQAKYAAEFQRLADGLAAQVLGTVEQAYTGEAVSGRGIAEKVQSLVSGTFDGVTEEMIANLRSFAMVYGESRKLTTEQTASLKATLDAMAAVIPVGGLYNGLIDEIRTSIAESGAPLTRQVSALAQYQKSGETTAVTLARMSTSLTQVNGVLESIHQTALGLSLASGDSASKLLDAAGGIGNLTTLAQGYYQAIYTEEQRRADAIARVSGVIAAAGFDSSVERSTSALRAEYDRIRLAQDLTTDSGRATYLQLLATSGEFGTLVDALYGTSSAAADAKTAAESAADAEKALAEQRTSLTTGLLQQLGATALLRQQELTGIDASNRGLQMSVWRLEDAKTAQDAYTASLQTAQSALDSARSTAASAQSAVDAVLQQATGNVVSATSAVAAAQDRITQLQVSSQKQVEQAARAAKQELQSLGKSMLDWAQGETARTGQDPAAEARSARAEYQRLMALAQAGDKDAQAKVSRSAETYLTSAESVSSGLDYATLRAQVLRDVTALGTRLAATVVPAETDNAPDELAAARTALAAAQAELAKAQAVAVQIGAPLAAGIEDLVKRAAEARAAQATAQADLVKAQATLDAIKANTAVAAEMTAATAAAIRTTVAAKFDQLDTTVDGLLTVGELSPFFRGLASDEQLVAIFRELDVNGDGTISRLEAVRGAVETSGSTAKTGLQQIYDGISAQAKSLGGDIGAWKVSLGSALALYFGAVDQNSDGKLSSDEAAGHFGALIKSQSEALAVFRAIDADGDGQITKLEAIRASAVLTEQRTDSTASRLLDVKTAIETSGSTAKTGLQQIYDGIGAQAKSLGGDIGAWKASLGSALALYFGALDKDEDGKLSSTEAAGHFGALLKSQTDALAVFRAIDADGDGQISKLEAIRAKAVDIGTDTSTAAINSGSIKTNTGAINTSALADIKTNTGALSTAPLADIKTNTATDATNSHRLWSIADNMGTLTFRGGGGHGGVVMQSANRAGTQAWFADGGYTGPGGKWEAAGTVHRGEIVWSQADIARAGGVSIVEAMRLGQLQSYGAGLDMSGARSAFDFAPTLLPVPVAAGGAAATDSTRQLADLTGQIRELIGRIDRRDRRSDTDSLEFQRMRNALESLVNNGIEVGAVTPLPVQTQAVVTVKTEEATTP